MHNRKRPHPILIAAAGALCTIGVIGIVARALHSYTTFRLYEPFASLAFVLAVVATTSGGVLAGWLIIRGLLWEVRHLRCENARLLAERATHDEMLAAVKAADQQGEINGVRLKKAIDLLRDIRTHQVIDEDTRPRGLAVGKLHSINGRGGA